MRPIALSLAILALVSQSGCMALGSLLAEALDHDESRRTAKRRGGALDSILPAGVMTYGIVGLARKDCGEKRGISGCLVIAAMLLEAALLSQDWLLWKALGRDDEYRDE